MELNNYENMASKNQHEGKRIGLNGRRYKEFLRLHSEKAKTPDHLLNGEDKQLIEDCNVQNSSSNNVEGNTKNSNSSCKALKKYPSKKTELSSCGVAENPNDSNFNYEGALSLFDSEYSGATVTEDINDVDPIIDKRKEREQYTEYECKRVTSKFAEFWVPVMLSDVQIEQYCASLYSKSFLLCSCTKIDSPVTLHDLLISARKTCDHPFLVDRSLRNLVLHGVPETDHFNTEIELSGKLRLLNKLLSEIEHREMRVLVYFQSMGGPGTISIGDILDDFIHEKFGTDSYARIDGNMSPAKKKAAIDRFNHKEKGRFVCLVEARAFFSSIKVMAVDTIIIYNSDWDPLNDLKALQKMSIYSQFEQLKVFRLYSSCTVEEKVLILAKKEISVDSNIKNIRKSTCHKLLTWGASLLFSKFDASSEHRNDPSNSNKCSNHTLLEDVFHELMCLLPYAEKHDANSSSSVVATNHPCNVVEVVPDGGSYLCTSSLSGELIADSADNYSIIRHLMEAEPPSLFWTNLLEWRQPRWRYVSNESQRNKKKVVYNERLPKRSKRNISDATKGSNTTVSHMLKKHKLISQRISQHSSSRKRCGSVKDLVNAKPSGHRKKKLKTLDGNGSNALANRAVCPSIIGVPTGNRLSPGSSGSLPFELPLPPSADLGPPVEAAIEELASWGMHQENRSFVWASGQEAQAPSQPAPSGPIDTNIHKMQESKEKAIKFHENLKFRIECERRKELEEVNKKFDSLSQKAESALVKTTTHIDTCCNTLNGHKLLGEAILQKHSYASATWWSQQNDTITGYMREVNRLCSSSAKDSNGCETGGSNPSAAVVGKDSLANENRLLIPRVNVSCGGRGRGVAVRAPAPHLRKSSSIIIKPTSELNLPKIEGSSGFCL